RRWTFYLRKSYKFYNYRPNKKLFVYRIFKVKYKAFIAIYFDCPGIKNCEITSELYKKFLDLYFTKR
ncbi:hypothetical protein QBC45DRAFT_321387, partial [Copromyces sp. CBS 386.78]